jgi:hypothetical protein
MDFILFFYKTDVTTLDVGHQLLDSAHILIFGPNETVFTANYIDFSREILESLLPQNIGKMKIDPRVWIQRLNQYIDTQDGNKIDGWYSFLEHDVIELNFQLIETSLVPDPEKVRWWEYEMRIVENGLERDGDKYEFIPL